MPTVPGCCSVTVYVCDTDVLQVSPESHREVGEELVTDFELFQSEFKRWQERFGLNGWQVYFIHKPLDKSYASISWDISNMTATAYLSSKVRKIDEPDNDIAAHAKHEAIHLLVGRLKTAASYRYISKDEIEEANEELVHKLEKLIE